MATTTHILAAKTPYFVQHPRGPASPPPCPPLNVVKKQPQPRAQHHHYHHYNAQHQHQEESSPRPSQSRPRNNAERERERDIPAHRPLVKAASFEIISSRHPLSTTVEKVRQRRIHAETTTWAAALTGQQPTPAQHHQGPKTVHPSMTRPQVEINIVDKATVRPAPSTPTTKARAISMLKKTLNAVDLSGWESELRPSNMRQKHEAAAAAAAAALAPSKSTEPLVRPNATASPRPSRPPIKDASHRANATQAQQQRERERGRQRQVEREEPAPVKVNGNVISPPMPVLTGFEHPLADLDTRTRARSRSHSRDVHRQAAIIGPSSTPPPSHQLRTQRSTLRRDDPHRRSGSGSEMAAHFQNRRRLSEAWCDLDAHADVEVLANEIKNHEKVMSERRRGKAREMYCDV